MIILKIKVEENPNLEEVEVIIRCPKQDSQIEKLVDLVSTHYLNLIGKLNGSNYVLTLDDIYYFESVDNHVFAYTEKNVYEVNYKIQELNDLLNKTYFIQTARTIILNINKIKKVNSLVNGRILAVLVNGEKMIITRVYAQDFKRKLKG